MNTTTKALVLSALVMLLSACANTRGYNNGYSNDGYYSSGSNYPGGGYNRNYPPPAYPYGGYQNNPYNRYPNYPNYRPYPNYRNYSTYPNYPANPGYGGHGRPYYGGYPNNNGYYNRNQPRPIPAPNYGNNRNPPPRIERQVNNYYYGRPPYNQGGKPGVYRTQPYPPTVRNNNDGRRYGAWQQQQPQRNYNTPHRTGVVVVMVVNGAKINRVHSSNLWSESKKRRQREFWQDE